MFGLWRITPTAPMQRGGAARRGRTPRDLNGDDWAVSIDEIAFDPVAR